MVPPVLLTLLWLLAGIVAPPPATTIAWFDAGTVPICHAEGEPLHEPAAPEHSTTCLLCPVCVLGAGCPVLIYTGPFIPIPVLRQALAAATVPPSGVPPKLFRTAARQRAPPAIQA